MHDAEQGAQAHHWLRQACQPAKHALDLCAKSGPAVHINALNQVGGTLDISSSKRVLYRFGEPSLLLIPAAGSQVEVGHQRLISLLQARAQGLGKQVVIAIPVPLVIQRDDKKVGLLQRGKPRLALLLASHCGTEGATELL